MRVKRILIVAFVALAFLTVFSTRSARADYYYYNPLFLPFAVAGAVVGTAAAVATGIATAPFYAFSPGYYGPGPVYYGSARAYYGPGYYGPGRVYYRSAPYRVHRSGWVRGHHDRYGRWVPAHRRY